MIRRRLFAIVAVMLGWLVITSAGGCAMLGGQQSHKKDGPQTVGQWINQPRVQP